MSLYVDIKKDFGSFKLDVKFETDNDVIALLGDSGCGKSMTLRAIAGIVTPDEGRIEINGKTVFDSAKKINLKPRDRLTGYLFQDYALFPKMTVFENIITGMERSGKFPEGKRVTAYEYLSGFQLENLKDRYPHELSGGQKQRCALARMLVSKPDIILLDEPFSALDATLRWEMEQIVRDTVEKFEGTSVLVTHNRDEVYRLADKVAVYNDGKIDVCDEKWKIFSNPQTMTTARLTGCKNLSPAYIKDGCVYAKDWQISFPCDGDEDTNWIGIRAHYLELAKEREPNSFPYEVVRKIEDTFSYIYQIRKAGASKAKTIRWEIDKSKNIDLPQRGYARVNPKDILLLR